MFFSESHKSALCVVILVICTSACRTTTQSPSASGEEEHVPLLVDEDRDSREPVIPAFLWSPSRRRSTAGYHYLVAEYMAMEGRSRESLPFFESAYNLDPNPFLAGRLIASEAQVGQFQAALPKARKMVLLYPKSGRLRFLYGKLLGRHGFYKQAEAEIERALDIEPTVEEVYAELIYLHQRARAYPKAIAVAKSMVEALPYSAQGWSLLARLYLTTEQRAAALTPARRAYQIQGNNPEYVMVYALALEMNKQSKKAVSLYEQLYRLNPTNEELIARMVELYRSVGDLSESLELLNELAELPGGSRPGIQLQRAILLWELRRFKEAADLLNALAKEFPERDQIKYMAGLGQEKMKELDRAFATFDKINQGSKFFPSAQLRMAIILRSQKEYTKALDRVIALEKDSPDQWEAYVLGSELYGEFKKYDESIAMLRRGYERHPNRTRLLFLVGVYQEKKGDIAETEKTMRQVIAADSQYHAAYNFLGYLFAERKVNLEEAEKLIQRALELKPDDGFYLDSLAWVYFQRGDVEKALPILLKANKAVPGEGVILEHIGDAYIELKDERRGQEYYQQALKGRLQEKDRERVLKKLQGVSKEAASS